MKKIMLGKWIDVPAGFETLRVAFLDGFSAVTIERLEEQTATGYSRKLGLKNVTDFNDTEWEAIVAEKLHKRLGLPVDTEFRYHPLGWYLDYVTGHIYRGISSPDCDFANYEEVSEAV